MKANIAGIIKDSIVDGPGIRTTVFFQGCPHNCLGCHNQSTHEFCEKRMYSVSQLVKMICKDNYLKLVTFSGGEPFCQTLVLKQICVILKNLNYHIVLYSGFTFEQLLENSSKDKCIIDILKICDILIDGKFVIDQKDLSLKFRGSANQRIINLKESINNGKVCLFHSLY